MIFPSSCCTTGAQGRYRLSVLAIRIGTQHELKRYPMEISMTENSNQRSARIYQFPVGGRAAPGARYEEPKVRDVVAERPNTALCSGGWYHEAAIQEAQQPAHER